MLPADLQEERSTTQREGPAGEGATLIPVQDSDVVRDGDTFYLMVNNLGERRLLFFASHASLLVRNHPQIAVRATPQWYLRELFS